MLDTLAHNLTIYMMAGVVIVVAISQVNRRVGAILGIVFWLSVALVGRHAYSMGNAIGIANIRFSEPVFYGLCALLAATNVFAAIAAKRRSRQT